MGIARRGWRQWTPAVCLVVAALIFAGFVGATGVTTWTGPGFSMFSTTDYVSTRSVHLELTTPTGRYPARLPAELDDAALELRNQPSAGRARSLAEATLGYRWALVDNVLVASPDGAFTATRAKVTLRTAEVSADGASARVLVAAGAGR